METREPQTLLTETSIQQYMDQFPLWEIQNQLRGTCTPGGQWNQPATKSIGKFMTPTLPGWIWRKLPTLGFFLTRGKKNETYPIVQTSAGSLPEGVSVLSEAKCWQERVPGSGKLRIRWWSGLVPPWGTSSMQRKSPTPPGFSPGRERVKTCVQHSVWSGEEGSSLFHYLYFS